MQNTDNLNETLYDEDFYINQKDGSYKSACEILPLVASILPKIESVIDIGCGVGTWLKAWGDLKDNISIFGIDGNSVDESLFYIPSNSYLKVDLTQNSKDLVKNVLDKSNIIKGGGGKPFDIAQSLEVAEHFDSKYAQNFVDILTSFSNIVLFSAAIPYQGGTHHVNEQAPSYWADLFYKKDFICFDIIRNQIWDNKNIEFWYRQNTILYIHKDISTLLEKQGFKSIKYPQHLVIPDIYEEVAKHLNYTCGEIQRLNKKLDKTFSRRLKYIINKIRGK